MAKQNEDMVKRLLERDPEFKRVYESHKDCEKKVSKLEKKPILSASETMEKKRLKKEKLSLKDRMHRLLAKRHA